MSYCRPNKPVQAAAAARFRFLALVVFIRSSCRPHLSPAAVPDLSRWGPGSGVRDGAGV
jgi:hypothetical protein